MSNLLIIEDDVMLNQGIAFNFQMDGFNITSAFTLEEAREKLDKENIDIIIGLIIFLNPYISRPLWPRFFISLKFFSIIFAPLDKTNSIYIN